MPPWVLARQPAYWRNIALKMEGDEAWAVAKDQEKKAKRRIS